MNVAEELCKMGKDGWRWKANNDPHTPGCEFCILAYIPHIHRVYGYGSTPEAAFTMLKEQIGKREKVIQQVKDENEAHERGG